MDHNIPPERLKWLITIAVMSVAVIEVLDMTIVNVALPNMMGALGASSDQITWVLTSYIVSSAICMPLTGFLVTHFGRKRLLLINIIGFAISSALCGMAVNLIQIVVFRTLQGIFGATLVPMSQFILRDTFPKSEQGKAMAIWGIGIMVGPVLGPTLGGYITEYSNWRWIFYVNLPICILAVWMTIRYISESLRTKQFLDTFGLILMAVGVGSLQYALDRGNQENWFQSNDILISMLISIYCLVFFVIRGLKYPNNIINLHIFKDRNFTLSTLILMIFCITVFGILALQPLLMQNYLNYPVLRIGLDMGPRGLACAVAMFAVSKMIGRIDIRIILITGVLLNVWSAYIMTQFSLDVSEYYFIITAFIQGFGMGLIFVPVSVVALSTLPPSSIAEGSGLFSFGRSIGSSVGISLFSTVLSRMSQSNWNRLGGHLTAQSPPLQNWLAAQHLTLASPTAMPLLADTLGRHSSMIAFVDCFWLSMVLAIISIPLILLLKPPKTIQMGPPGH